MKHNWLKYILGLAACVGLRLVPFRPPHMEPILATAMPFAKQYGYWSGALFGGLSIGIFDLATGTLGSWSAITATAYALVGLGAAGYLKRRPNTALHYLAYSVAGTIAYDALTGLTIGPLMFGQPFMEALTGQIPFTLMHVASNAILAVTLSPLLYRWVVVNRRLEPAAWHGTTDDRRVIS